MTIIPVVGLDTRLFNRIEELLKGTGTRRRNQSASRKILRILNDLGYVSVDPAYAHLGVVMQPDGNLAVIVTEHSHDPNTTTEATTNA